MEFVFGRITLLRLKNIVVFVIALILIACVVNVFGLNIQNQTVRAIEPKPVCTSGGVYGNGILSYFTIKLTCSDLPTSADNINASYIKLVRDGVNYPPESASVDGDELSLIFNANYGSQVRDIVIDAGAITNDSGFVNDNIYVQTAYILDYVTPNLVDDAYSANYDSELNVPAEIGVLVNDVDNDTGVSNAVVLIEPTEGTLILNTDGSFTYTPFESYSGSDSFVYVAEDESGNQSSATVYLNDNPPEITPPYAYRDNPDEDPNYVKVGDRIRVDFETNEPVTVDGVMIANHNAMLDVVDLTHFSFYYDMQADDEEGVVRYSITVSDSVGKTARYSNEDGVYFDKTKPVIDLNGDDYVELVINTDYSEPASATDDHDVQATVYSDIIVDTSIVGTYIVTYSAFDNAGNQADAVTRTVVVVDLITKATNTSDNLRLYDLENNLDLVNLDNVKSFPGLYIERSLEGQKFGRITFNNPIDLSNTDIQNFLGELMDRMELNELGTISFDVSGITDLLDYFGNNITIKFYNLDKLGFNNESTLDDVFSKLEVYDDNGKKMSNSDIDRNSAVYVGCVNDQDECYTFTMDINHFSKYVINKIDYQKADDISIVVPGIVTLPLIMTNNNIASPVEILVSGDTWYGSSESELGSQTTVSEQPVVKKKINESTKESLKKSVEALVWQWWLMVGLAIILPIWSVYILFYHRDKI